MNIHTVEVLAECSDQALLGIGHGARELQNAAKLFLEEAPAKVANPPVQDADLRAENERLEARITELEAKTAEQRAKLKKQAKKIAALKSRKAA